MLLKFADNGDPNSWASRLRRKRTKQLLDLIPPGKPTRILDVGGTEHFWMNLYGDSIPSDVAITIVNITLPTTSQHPQIKALAGDARDLSCFQAGQFDVCFSNSVIEHVGTLLDQQRMAAEIRRVAKRYFVQTPYRYFPIEPHFHVLGWAQMPVPVRIAMHRHFDLGWMSAQPDYELAKSDVEQIRLLNVREVRALFPDARLVTEQLGPLLKSLIAIR
jgi:hypothetical protein